MAGMICAKGTPEHHYTHLIGALDIGLVEQKSPGVAERQSQFGGQNTLMGGKLTPKIHSHESILGTLKWGIPKHHKHLRALPKLQDQSHISHA